ncbi:unnamed protein product, partial [Ectocarpus fasciculatus]
LATGSVDIDQRYAQGVTPLILATLHGHSQIVEILLRKGATVSMVANDGFTALHACALTKDPSRSVVKLLIRAGAALEAKMMTTEGHHTPLHTAALRGRSEMVKTLIEAGANPDSRMSSGGTALHAHRGWSRALGHDEGAPSWKGQPVVVSSTPNIRVSLRPTGCSCRQWAPGHGARASSGTWD